jgi:gamma-glutamylcyclotransferase (GGCT)/AIG2-like uncharacterized protein YtfP
MSGINPRLFVYGTLMSCASGSFGKAERERLAREARKLGEGTIQGRLYRLRYYPGLVASEDPDELVHGEVYALMQPERSFTWLDAYEGLMPGGRGDFERIERPVKLATGWVTAWVYQYCRPVGQLPMIPGGRWTSGEAD